MGQLLGSLLWVTLGAIGLMPPLIENLCPEAKGAKTKQKKKQKKPKKQQKKNMWKRNHLINIEKLCR